MTHNESFMRKITSYGKAFKDSTIEIPKMLHLKGGIMKKSVISVLLLFAFLATSCDTPQGKGAMVGGAVGGVAGALVGKSPWTGAIVGAGLGAILGAAITDIAVKGSREAAASGRPVEYRTEDGGGVYRAEPVGKPIYRSTSQGTTTCRKVHEVIWENGVKKEDRIREVCEATKTEPGY